MQKACPWSPCKNKAKYIVIRREFFTEVVQSQNLKAGAESLWECFARYNGVQFPGMFWSQEKKD